MKDTVKYWVDLSDYDLVTGEAMLETKRYLYVEARYPSQKERLLRSLTERKCIELINTTKDLQRWIKNML